MAASRERQTVVLKVELLVDSMAVQKDVLKVVEKVEKLVSQRVVWKVDW
jgi:hypothetical protein